MQKNLSSTGKRIIKIGIFFNILLFIVAVILLIKGDFFGQSPWMVAYHFLSIPVVVYWLYLIRRWYLYDKDINHFLGLLFLMGFYSIYYGVKVLSGHTQE